jgi:hypothetical protein
LIPAAVIIFGARADAAAATASAGGSSSYRNPAAQRLKRSTRVGIDSGNDVFGDKQ